MSEVAEIRTLLGRAYADDPLSVWIFRNERIRADACAAWYGLFVEAYRHVGQITEVIEDGRLVAVCLWRRPDDPPLHTLAADTLPGMAGLLEALVGAEHAAVVGNALHGIAPPDPRCAYVNFLAVQPELRGHGFGRRALAAALGSGAPVRLETTNPRNLSFYERAGFIVTGRLQLGDGPLVRMMERRPD